MSAGAGAAAERNAVRLRIYQLELEHWDARHAYIRTKLAPYQRRMREISAQLAELRNGGAAEPEQSGQASA